MAWTQWGHAALARNGLARSRGLSDQAGNAAQGVYLHAQPGAECPAFLYREVLAIDLPWMDKIGRPAYKRYIPSVLTCDEVAGVRLMEGIRLARRLADTALLLSVKSAQRRLTSRFMRRRRRCRM